MQHDLDAQLIRRRYEQGERTIELAAVVGVSRRTIERRIVAAGGNLRGRVRDDLDAQLLRRLYEQGESTVELAERFAVSQRTIAYRIVAAGGTLIHSRIKPRRCALRSCRRRFTPARAGIRFCSPEHWYQSPSCRDPAIAERFRAHAAA